MSRFRQMAEDLRRVNGELRTLGTQQGPGPVRGPAPGGGGGGDLAALARVEAGLQDLRRAFDRSPTDLRSLPGLLD